MTEGGQISNEPTQRSDIATNIFLYYCLIHLGLYLIHQFKCSWGILLKRL